MKSLSVIGKKTILFILFAVASLFSANRALSQECDTALDYARARDLEIERAAHEEGFVY